MQDQKGYMKNNIRAEEEQITAARVKQHEDEEEGTGIRLAVSYTYIYNIYYIDSKIDMYLYVKMDI